MMLSSLRLISSKQTVSSNQCLCCSTGLRLSMAQDKTPKRGCRWPVVDNPHRSRLMLSFPWLIVYSLGAHKGRRSWGGEVLTPWKYVERVRVCFDPLKMSHSFIQNCCCIAASFTTVVRVLYWNGSLCTQWPQIRKPKTPKFILNIPVWKFPLTSSTRNQKMEI